MSPANCPSSTPRAATGTGVDEPRFTSDDSHNLSQTAVLRRVPADAGHAFLAAFILPTLAHTAPAYVNDVIAAANNGKAIGDIGLMQTVIYVTGIAYLAGGFIFGIALFRANVLARWAAALLAVGTLATIGTGILPQ